jgi:hypothetical protein
MSGARAGGPPRPSLKQVCAQHAWVGAQSQVRQVSCVHGVCVCVCT